MQPITQNHNIVDAVSEEFKGEYFYGLELILDELYDPKAENLANNKAVDVDWFGLSDFCI